MDSSDDIRQLGSKAAGFELWGVPVEQMDREQLMGFIVFLDDALMNLTKGIAPQGMLEQTYEATKKTLGK